MEIPDDTADGQHFKCPFCGEKTAYCKPARVEVPNGAKKATSKPKIGIRRQSPTEISKKVEMEDRLRMAINPQPPKAPVSAPKGVVTAAEERVKLFEEMRRKEARQKMVRNFVESATLLLAFAVLVGLVLWWQSHRNKVAAEAARIEAEAEADRIRLKEERDRLAREQREKDRLEREAERTREAERRKKEQEELAMRRQKEKEEQERQLREERESKERAEREIRDNKEFYQQCLLALRENEFDIFTKSVTNDLDAAGGGLCYLFPSLDFPVPLYYVALETNGSSRVFMVEESGKRVDVEWNLFNDKIKRLEYLVAKKDKVFFKSQRKTPSTGLLNIAKESDPAEAFFGTLAPTLKELKPTYNELTFDIFFTKHGSSKEIFVENLPFGCAWSCQSVMEAIEKSTPRYGGSSISSSPKRKFKRTVKIWNGTMTKKGIDGITYVPRTPPPERVRTVYRDWPYRTDLPNVVYRSSTQTHYNTRAQWQALYDQALREDAEETAFNEQQRQNRASAQAAADEKWEKKIDKMFRAGTLSYHIRKAKVKE